MEDPKKYIKVTGLRIPENAFRILENEYIDIMYPEKVIHGNLIILLDEGFDAEIENDLLLLKELLDSKLLEVGETEFHVSSHYCKT